MITLNPEISRYINAATGEQKKIMELLRKIIHQAVPDVKEEFKWNRPVFRSSVDFTYFNTTKSYLTIGFFNFHALVDENKILEGSGKDMRHVKLKSVKDVNEELFADWFKTVSGTK